MQKYPEWIMMDVRRAMGVEANDTSKDQLIEAMSKRQVLSKVCQWNNLIGDWAGAVISWVEGIYGVNLIDK